VRHGPDQQAWCSRVAEDYDNIRAAIDFGIDRAPDLAARLVGNLQFFFWLRGGFAEAAGWVGACLAREHALPPAWRSRLHECGALVWQRLGDIERASRHADEAYRIAASAGDDGGMANGLRERAKVAVSRGETDGVRAIYAELETVSERAGDAWNAAIALNNLGDLALQEGDWRAVVDKCTRSSELRRSMGDHWGSALATLNVAEAQLELGELARQRGACGPRSRTPIRSVRRRSSPAFWIVQRSSQLRSVVRSTRRDCSAPPTVSTRTGRGPRGELRDGDCGQPARVGGGVAWRRGVRERARTRTRAVVRRRHGARSRGHRERLVMRVRHRRGDG